MMVNNLCIPLQTPIIRTPPKRRTSRMLKSAKTIRRSVRIAAKPWEANSTRQAQAILLKKLGIVVNSPATDSEVVRKFRATFSEPLTASKHEALQALFDGDFDPSSLGLDAIGVEEAMV